MLALALAHCDPIDLEAFVSVVERGSIVAAAAALHLTQSAVTRRVKAGLSDEPGIYLNLIRNVV